MNKVDFTKRLIIIGCGGHSKMATEIALDMGLNKINYFDSTEIEKILISNLKTKEINEKYNDYFFVAIGDNYTREQVFEKFLIQHPNAKPINLIHKSSNISPESRIGVGTIIMPLSAINISSKIGKGVIINTSSSVDHDNKIKNFSSIAPGVHLGGNVTIGSRTAISIGATIKHKVTIGNDVLVGAASLVLSDISDNLVVYGAPARKIKKRKNDEKYL